LTNNKIQYLKGIEELKIVGNQFNQSDFAPHGIGIWHDNTGN
jgi:hypothetical protein